MKCSTSTRRHIWTRKRLKRLDRYSQFAVACARIALDDARLDLPEENRDLIGCYVGSALGGAAFAEEQMKVFAADGIRRVKLALALSVFGGAASCNIAIEYDLRGPNSANSDSCRAARLAIGEAFRLIRDGYADVILAGGAEAPQSPLVFGAFTVIRAMSTRNDDLAAACWPFDRARDGLVMAEGAALLVLEEWDHARLRGAPVYGGSARPRRHQRRASHDRAASLGHAGGAGHAMRPRRGRRAVRRRGLHQRSRQQHQSHARARARRDRRGDLHAGPSARVLAAHSERDGPGSGVRPRLHSRNRARSGGGLRAQQFFRFRG